MTTDLTHTVTTNNMYIWCSGCSPMRSQIRQTLATRNGSSTVVASTTTSTSTSVATIIISKSKLQYLKNRVISKSRYFTTIFSTIVNALLQAMFKLRIQCPCNMHGAQWLYNSDSYFAFSHEKIIFENKIEICFQKIESKLIKNKKAESWPHKQVQVLSMADLVWCTWQMQIVSPFQRSLDRAPSAAQSHLARPSHRVVWHSLLLFLTPSLRHSRSKSH